MDISEQYKDLTEMINVNLPLKAYPIRELVRNFHNNGHPVTLKTELKITSAYNSGNISGIMCTVELSNGYKMACALTHLFIHKSTFLYSEIADYQRKREKRIKQLNSRGMN